ncbi:MAG: universal stress protein [Acidobacteriia bacterium]|nr:universal stress protein [Terriglobia bacterium]
MYKNILIPTDGSPLSDNAVSHGIALAKVLGAKVTALTVTVPFQIFTLDTQMVETTAAEYTRSVQERVKTTLNSVATAAKTAGVACETLNVEHEHPYQAIIDTAQSKGCDLVVMASHGRRGVAAVVLGSVTVKVLTHSKVPVLVYR